MISITVNNMIVPLKNIMYHHKKKNIPDSQSYRIEMDMKYDITMKFLEKYIGKISDKNGIVQSIKVKEEAAGSLGIIWHIIQYLRDTEYSYEDSNKPYPMLITVDDIYIQDNTLVISGKAEG